MRRPASSTVRRVGIFLASLGVLLPIILFLGGILVYGDTPPGRLLLIWIATVALGIGGALLVKLAKTMADKDRGDSPERADPG